MTAKSLEYASDASHPPLFLPEREPLLIGFYTPDWFWGFFLPILKAQISFVPRLQIRPLALLRRGVAHQKRR